MSVPDSALDSIRRFCVDRTPPTFRDQMRLDVTVRGNSVTVTDCSRMGPDAPDEWMSIRIAQLRYEPSSARWTLYWADRNDRWHRYHDLEATPDLGSVIREIDRDPTCIFFG